MMLGEQVVYTILAVVIGGLLMVVGYVIGFIQGRGTNGRP